MTKNNKSIKDKSIAVKTNFFTQVWKNLREYPLEVVLYFSFFLLTLFSSTANHLFLFPSIHQILSILIAGIFIFFILKYKKSFFDKNFFYVFILLHIIFSILLIYNMYSVKIRGINFFFFPAFACFMYLLSLFKWYSKQFVVKVSNYIFLLYIVGIIIAFSVNSFFSGILFLFICGYYAIFMLLFLIFSSPNENSDELKNFQSVCLFIFGGISYPLVFLYLTPLVANMISE